MWVAYVVKLRFVTLSLKHVHPDPDDQLRTGYEGRG
jgi:hypothetical protein